MFFEKGFLTKCIKFTGEHPWRSVISIKLLCNFIEIKLCHGCSPVNLQHIFRTPFPKNTSGGLLLYPATSQKKRTPRRVFPDEFCEVLKTPFLTALGNYFCSTEKYFTNKIVKNSLRKKELKKKKWKQLVRKTTAHAKQKLNRYLHQVFISFYYSKLFYLSFLSFP